MNSETRRVTESPPNEHELISSVQHLIFYHTTDERAQYTDYARKLSITPENYAVWYEYFIGCTPELNKSIDDLVSKKVTFSEQVNTELYATYIKERPVSNLLGGIQSDTKYLLNRLLSELETIKDDTE